MKLFCLENNRTKTLRNFYIQMSGVSRETYKDFSTYYFMGTVSKNIYAMPGKHIVKGGFVLLSLRKNRK